MSMVSSVIHSAQQVSLKRILKSALPNHSSCWSTERLGIAWDGISKHKLTVKRWGDEMDTVNPEGRRGNFRFQSGASCGQTIGCLRKPELAVLLPTPSTRVGGRKGGGGVLPWPGEGGKEGGREGGWLPVGRISLTWPAGLCLQPANASIDQARLLSTAEETPGRGGAPSFRCHALQPLVTAELWDGDAYNQGLTDLPS